MTEFEPERVVIRDNRKIDRQAAAAAADQDARAEADQAEQASPTAAPTDAAGEVGADGAPDANAQLLDERTRDLQRLQAEYANYRRRAERDRLLAGDIAVGRMLADLLPVIDDLDRARAHGDLTGALKAVADKLDAAFGKVGLEAFGAVGDPFDPAIHEAVMHDESADVTVATCTTVLRQGYRHHDRLLRPAMVGVSDPVAGGGAGAQPGTDAGGQQGDALRDAVDGAADSATATATDDANSPVDAEPAVDDTPASDRA